MQEEIKKELHELRKELERVAEIVDRAEFDKAVAEAVKKNGNNTAEYDQKNKGLIKYLFETIRMLIIAVVILAGTKIEQIKGWFQ